MPNDSTTLGFELPHPDNIAREDAGRVRSAIQKINTSINDLNAKETPAATESVSGRVRLATAAEATAGTATDAVPTIKRTKDIVSAALAAAQAALTALQNHVAEELAAADDEIDQAIDAMNAEITTRLNDFNTALTNGIASKLDKAGGTMTGDLSMDRPKGTGVNFRGKIAGKDRWVVQLGNGVAETGSGNVGSDFGLLSYNDDGSFLRAPLTFNRATGQATFSGSVTVNYLTSNTGGRFNGDLYTNRGNNTGYLGLGTAGNAYLYWDGGSYSMPTGYLYGPSGRYAYTGEWNGQINACIQSMRGVHAGDYTAFLNNQPEIGSAWVTGVWPVDQQGGGYVGWITCRTRYHQYYTPNSGWVTYGWAS
jgi:hypothetical protein